MKQVKWIVMMAPQLTFDLYLGKLSQHFRFSFQHFLASLIAFSLSSYFSSIFFFIEIKENILPLHDLLKELSHDFKVFFFIITI